MDIGLCPAGYCSHSSSSSDDTYRGLGELLLQVRRNLHVVLCFSPVGDKFRIRARQFPALINCVAIDWFHTWPSEVPRRLLSSLSALPAAIRCLLGK